MFPSRTIHSSYAPWLRPPPPRRRAWLAAAAAGGIALLAGCAAPPPVTTTVTLTLAAAADGNPDAQGRASPVVARFYALKTPTAFEAADFFSLQDKDQATLSADLVQREEVVLRPGERKSFRLKLAADVSTLGFMGAYRDLNHARWRQTLALTPGTAVDLTVSYGARGITLTRH